MRRALTPVVAALVLAGLAAFPAIASGPPGVVDPTTPAARETEPVVMTGAQFPGWAAPADQSVKAPSASGLPCTDDNNTCSHNRYNEPEVSTGDHLGHGVDVGKLLGYRWDGRRFVQIPF